jgi:hypothetical protein
MEMLFFFGQRSERVTLELFMLLPDEDGGKLSKSRHFRLLSDPNKLNTWYFNLY